MNFQMEEAKRLRVKRRALKGSITKLSGKVQGELAAKLETVNVETVPEARRILVSTTVDQLKSKLKQIIELDDAIVNTIQEEEELETEMCDADTYQATLEQQIALLVEYIRKASESPVARAPTPPLTMRDRSPPRLLESAGTATEPEMTAATLPETEPTKKLLHSDSTVPEIEVTKNTETTEDSFIYTSE